MPRCNSSTGGSAISTALRTLASTATATSANVSGAGCSTSRPQSVHRPGRAWNSTEPPAWDSPIAAAEYTRLYEEIRRTRHWVSAINGTGASSAYTGGRSTAIGTNQAPSMSLAFIPAGSGTRRVASTDAAVAARSTANNSRSRPRSGVDHAATSAHAAASSVIKSTRQRVAAGSSHTAHPRGEPDPWRRRERALEVTPAPPLRVLDIRSPSRTELTYCDDVSAQCDTRTGVATATCTRPSSPAHGKETCDARQQVDLSGPNLDRPKPCPRKGDL